MAASRAHAAARAAGAAPALGWLSDGVTLDRRLGSTETTAQVHPGRVHRGMMRAAQAHGAELRSGGHRPCSRPDGARARGVEVDGETLEGDAVVIAMGPWSILASGWLPLPRVFGLKGHSLVFETGATVPAEALFLEYQEAERRGADARVFPRPDGTTYVCAISSESPLPVDPADVGPIRRDRAAGGVCGRFAGAARSEDPRAAGLLPAGHAGRPAADRPVPGIDGAYVATGHSVWGILNAPATGEAMAELILDGAAHTVDLSPFDPGRLPAVNPGARFSA